MKYLFMFLLSTSLFARTTYDQILDNSSRVPVVFAKALAATIDHYSSEHRVPANVITAIFMVESSYRLNAVNKRSDDFGIGQVNKWHIKHSKLDKDRLLNDLNYSVEQSIIIFKWFYKTYPLHEAIKRYNAGTKKEAIHWKPVKRYLRLVRRYM
jgi:hypothetical protein